MSDPSEPLPPLSPELEEFFRPEREGAEPPAGIADGIFSRLRATLDLPLPPLRPLDPTAPPHTTAPTLGSGDASSRPTPAGSGDLLPAHARATLMARPSIRTLATLLIGAAVGAGIHEGFDRRERRAEQRRAGASMSAPAAFPPPPAAPPPNPPTEAPPAAAPVTEPAKAADSRVSAPPAKDERGVRPELERRDRDRDLAAERTLIEQARTALSREKGEAALSVLERHGREFPHAALEEERESLLVQVMVKLDRNEQARKIGARFHRRFPRSIFGTVVDQALGSIP